MRIDLERSGGFAGIRQTSSVSTDQMSEDEARKVANLVDGAGFYELPSEIRSTGPGADRFQYKITVESEHGTHVVQVDEAAVPPRLQPVLDWMKSVARARAGK
jgi:emfourin